MILGSESVEISKMLFAKHVILFQDNLSKNKKFHPINQESSLLPEYFNYSKPMLVTSKTQLESIKKQLSDRVYPLGKLGVETTDLYIDELSSSEVLQYQHAGAIELIKKTCPWMYEMMCSVSKVFVPIDCPDHYIKAGFSSNYAKGFVFMNYPKDRCSEQMFELAIDYVHETSHQLTFLLNEVDPTITENSVKEVYSAIKGCNRPTVLALHGAIALAYMTLFRVFHRSLSGKYVFHSLDKLKQEREMLKETIDSMKGKVEFTDVGSRIFKNLNEVYQKVS